MEQKHTEKGEQYWIDVEEFKKWVISQNYHIEDGEYIKESVTNYRIAVTKETENNSRRPSSDSFSCELKYHAEATVLSYAR